MSYPVKFTPSNSEISVHHPEQWLWIIEIKHGVDNRLNKEIILEGLQPALDVVEKDWRMQWRHAKKEKAKQGPKGALIFVGALDQDKFFGNGFEFEKIINDPNFFHLTWEPFCARVLTFPIPTVAAINGHCFAAAFGLATACDYRVMTDGSKRRAWLSMNEVHFGAIWPLSFAALFRCKYDGAQRVRKIALEGHRWTPQEALKEGIVDHIVAGDTAAVMAKATEVAGAIAPNAAQGVWGLIKSDLYRDVLDAFHTQSRHVSSITDDQAAGQRLGLAKL
ncbi:ClpP/crotonase [Cylindrobasidium torrendii FP15055 ss-10]|uniref:ClpP/crotonase n=1 Tax=Cylindrobasidium torrendii FP15055 ss-10 TaxID=1314674 RepID=A0A0D7B7K0_9AGAR|nr:ClpP/crotonase [Cylindrobasidium torrendii FP15055 ss-10]